MHMAGVLEKHLPVVKREEISDRMGLVVHPLGGAMCERVLEQHPHWMTGANFGF